ncbi:hypothetical protein [Blautia sp. MSJ-19]|uniref:hypothetical protein n=1 Tax=Blautia sp. MSJ-19 TaxID=2841517 RepID=UPI001C0EF706|nr:hypothetical protein [Blautia sp. MSJ-19]MBU5479731.1 hypothetical protein [Blautia sp. MSJ-19]
MKQKRNSGRMRILAWILTAVMLCTGMNTTVFAENITFEDEIMTEASVNDDVDVQIDAEDEEIPEAEIQEEAEDEESEEEITAFSDGEQEDAALPEMTDGTAAKAVNNGDTASVTVYLSLSHDADYLSEIGKLKEPVALKKLTVPYFDLANYGLQKYYFSSEDYDSSGVNVGTAETAYNHVTMLHLLIYATEVLYCGVDESAAGQGYLKTQGYLDDGKTLNIEGNRGSLFMRNFWGMDLNLTYYKNYQYPMADTSWGSTADQILMKDGDVYTLAHYTDWNFYTDSSAGFNYLKVNGTATEATVNRADEDSATIETWCASEDWNDPSGTAQKKMTQSCKLFYVPVDEMWDGDISTWDSLGTTENGALKVDLSKLSNGTYFVAMEGQKGTENPASVVSSPGGIYLTVTGEAVKKELSVSLTLDKTEVQGGDKVRLSAEATGGSGSYTYKFIVCDEKGNWYRLKDFGQENVYEWTTGPTGKKTLYVDAKDSSGTVKRAEAKCEVTGQPLDVTLSVSPEGSVMSGETVSLHAKATGGSGSYTYKFIVCDEKGNWYKMRDFRSDSTLSWTPGPAGKKTLYVDAKDSFGTVKRASVVYEVKASNLSVVLKVSPANSVVSGKTVRLSAEASGGIGGYTYKFIVCDEKGNWYRLRDFGVGSTFDWTPGPAGKKTLYVDVKDKTGLVKRASVSYEVKNK